MSVGWDVKWCPVLRITTVLAHKGPFHWISMEGWLVKATRETLNDWNIADKAKNYIPNTVFVVVAFVGYQVAELWKEHHRLSNFEKICWKASSCLKSNHDPGHHLKSHSRDIVRTTKFWAIGLIFVLYYKNLAGLTDLSLLW